MRRDDPTSVPRILVVEDEAIIANDLRRRLERLGYEVVGIADNGADALAMAAEHKPTLVFMDIIIQGPIDGIETATKLVRRMDVPIVFLTAHADEATVQRAKAVGPYGYLVKPFEERELHTTVEITVYRHQTEAKARFLRHAISSAATGITVVDARCAELPIIECNAALERMSGYSGAEILGRSAGFLLGPDTDPTDAEIVAGALANRLECQVTLQLHRQNGTSFWSDLSLSPIRDTAGDVTHFLCFHSDVTARRQTEAALLQAQKMEAVGQLTSGIAHDFNNILAVILGFSGFVRDGLPEGDPRREDIAEVLRAADRAAALTRQLLTFSRQQPSAKRPLDLNSSAANLVKMLRRSVGEGIEVDIVSSARPAVVRMDPVQFDQVLLNLALNARDAMQDAGRIRFTISHPAEPVGTFRAGRCVRLTATDTGCGMDRATQARIFEPFFTTKAVGKGTGLGLATCFAIVNDAGGTIGVDSGPGTGTTFTIDLPVCDEPLDDAVEVTAPTLRGDGERVLVVEDDAAVRKAAVRILESAGYLVSQAKDGDEAIVRLGEAAAGFDLIVTDVVMPGRGGYALLEHAQKHAPQTRVLLTSGYVDGRAGASSALDEPALLWKPYSSTSLLRAAHAALDHGRAAKGTAEVAAQAVGARARNVVLLIEDQVQVSAAIQRVLVGAGYEVAVADTVAAARDALGSRRDYAAVLCDLTLPDGSGASLVTWLREVEPALARRTLVLTGGATDDAGSRLMADGVTEVLRKPIAAQRLLERVGVLASRASDAATGAPVQPTVKPRTRQSQPAPQAAEARSVLFVDDEDAQREAYGRALRAAGFAVTVASSGEEAMDLLGRQPFHAVVTDIGLPGLDGLAVLRAARARDADVPVLLITGAPSVETATMAVQSHAVGYLAKPFSPQLLVAEVERAVEAGDVLSLQKKLLTARAGADEYLVDLPGTRRSFDAALKGLRMAFQPIVRSQGGSIFGYEALLRSDEPLLSSPLKVLAAAEALGRMDDVGHAVRRAVANSLAQHPGRTEAIFVNLHPSELRSDLLCAATEPLRRSAGRIVLEVTERTSLSMGPELSEEVRLLRAAGYRVAIDDLGEGYAGLSWLAHLRPDIAKIDMSLVRDIHRSPLQREIVGSLINVCRRAGITALGEGVESAEEAELLTDLGCDLLQGYFFAKPGPAFPEVRGAARLKGSA